MKQISAWSIRHPVLPLVLFVVLGFLGTVAFIRLPINLNPDIAYPIVSVTIAQPGAAPTEIETQITQKVEGAVASVGAVRSITSVAREGMSDSTIEFQIGTPIDRAVNDVRDAVAKVRSDLPDGIDEPLIQRMDVDGGPIAYFAVSTTGMTPVELSWFVDNTITKRLLAVPGVAQISRGGGVDREIRIELDPARMQALGITAVEVNQQLRQLNIDAPGGRAQVGGGEQAIRVLGGAKSALDLGATQINVGAGKVVRLRDIAQVHDGTAEIRTISRFNGRPATTFGVSKSRGSSDVTVLELVEQEIAAIRKERPEVDVKLVFTTVAFTKISYHSALVAMIEGSILAVIVVFLFLRDWRATGISALAIPLSAIPTFAFMHAMDFTLNMVSLLGLSLVAGVLVDDAIVEIENIVRHMRMGKSAYQAALDAADEIGLAVVATSATIIAVFLPVSFMGGVTGQFFRQFGLTVAAAVFMSLLVARLLTPLIAAYTLRSGGHHEVADGPIMTAYLVALRACMRHRWRTVLGGVAFFALSVLALSVIPTSFAPQDDMSSSALKIELPPGVRLEDTDAVARQAADILRRQSEVTDIIEFVGADEAADVRNITMYVNLLPPGDRNLSQQQWEDRVLRELRTIPDVRVNFQSQGQGLGRDLTLFLVGEDPATVQQAAARLVDEMRSIKGVVDPRINGDLQRPEVVITPRLDLAADLGVTVGSISQTIRIATLGDLPQNAAKFSLSDRQVPIRVSLLETSRRDLATLENLPVPTASGGTVPLKSVAELRFGQGPSTIRRYNQNRRVAVDADLEGVELGPAREQIDALPAIRELPPGVRIVEVGDADLMKELFDNFVIAIGAGVLMVFAVLVLLFVRVFQPITILSALPLSVGGAALALILAGHSMSLPAVIGIIMLMGIVAKNSILLVDFAIEEMRAGRDRTTALIESGHKRARPIVMTTVAMVAGMVPIALGLGDGSAFRKPMAIAVIGGLITSTALTLVIVPAVFTIIDDIEQWLAPRVRRLLGGEEATGSASQDSSR